MRDENIEEVVRADLSLRKDHSLYIGPGHTTVLYYEPRRQELLQRYGEDMPGQEWLIDHLQTNVIVDLLLVQRWILKILDRQFDSVSIDLTRLNSLRRDFLTALKEYHEVAVTYGSAQDIIGYAREQMGIIKLHQSITQKLGILEKLIENEESRRRNRRDVLLKAGTALVTLLFGLPLAARMVEIMSDWDEIPTDVYNGLGVAGINALVRFVHEHPTSLTIMLYVVSVLVVLPLVIWSLFPARRPKQAFSTDKSESAYIPGFTWSDDSASSEELLQPRGESERLPSMPNASASRNNDDGAEHDRGQDRG